MNQKHIEDILSRIGISCGMNGYRYIVDALLLLDQEGVDDVKYTYLYHLIARKNQSTADRVERDMRYAFSRAREKNTCLRSRGALHWNGKSIQFRFSAAVIYPNQSGRECRGKEKAGNSKKDFRYDIERGCFTHRNEIGTTAAL